MRPLPCLLLFLCVFLTLVCCQDQLSLESYFSNSPASGFKSGLTQRGINHIRDIIVKHVKSQLNNVNLGDSSGKDHHIKWSVKDVRLVNPKFGSAKISNDGKGVRLTITDISFEVKAKWKYRYHLVKDSGKADIKVSSTKAAVSLEIKPTSKGAVAAKSHSPSLKIGSLKVKLHGSPISSFYNLFKGKIASSIKKSAEKSFKKELTSTVNKAIKKSLTDVKTIFPVDQYSDLDLRLQSIVYSGNTFISPSFNGNFLPHGHLSRPPLKTKKMPTSLNNKHVQIFLNEYFFNSGSYVYHRSNVLRQVVTDADIPESSWIHLNTKSFRFIAPKLYQRFPDMPMEAVIATSDYPKLTLNSTNLRFTIPIEANLTVVTPSGKHIIASIGMTVNTVAHAKLSKMRLHGSIDLLNFRFVVLHSEVGHFEMDELAKVINDLCRYGILPFFNVALKEGVEIPVTKGVTIKAPVLHFGDGFLGITSDIDYKF